jgi:hypothetical protein
MTPWMEPIRDASVWTGDDLEKDRSWEFVLDEQHKAELAQALTQVNKDGLSLVEITKENFPLSVLGDVLQRLQEELIKGKGFALLRGVPTEGYDLKDLEKIYWGLCTYLGTGVTQNSEAGLIHYVTDGKLRPQQGTRGVGNPGPVGLHVDLTDCVALFCVRQAPDDPHSLVASSMTLYNEILKQHPEWLPQLYEGFIWNRANEEGQGETPVSNYKVPAFSEVDGVVTCRFNGHWIKAGLERMGETLTEEEAEIFDFISKTAAENSFAFPLHKGEIAFCNNYTVFHGREGHAPIEDEEQKRVLLRIWMDLPNVRPFADEGRIRYGVVRHGNLGWTAKDLLMGKNSMPHRRRMDGVPEINEPIM